MGLLVRWLQTLPETARINNNKLKMKRSSSRWWIYPDQQTLWQFCSNWSSFWKKKITETKTLAKKRSSHWLKNFKYKKHNNTKLCMVFMWEKYFRKTKHITKLKNRVFIEHKLLNSDIGSQIIAKDTMKAMNLDVINTFRFKAHFTRMTGF